MGAQGVHPSAGCRDVFCKARADTGQAEPRESKNPGDDGEENLTAPGFRASSSTHLPRPAASLYVLTLSLHLAGMPTGTILMELLPVSSLQQPLNPDPYKPYLGEAVAECIQFCAGDTGRFGMTF